MPNVPAHSAIHRGTNVSIILKADQATGRQVSGSVADVLTRGNHPRGVKVRLSDGRVGRVQAIMSNNPNNPFNNQANQYNNQSNQYNNQPNQYGNQQNQYNNQLNHYGNSGGGYGNPVPEPYRGGYSPQPRNSNTAPNRTLQDEEENLVDPSERTEQLEYFESYENARAPTKEERDRAQLQQEFKGVDGSLVAAMYGDCNGDLSACREMLQAIQ